MSAWLSRTLEAFSSLDCLGSCWEAVTLNGDCKHLKEKDFWHVPVHYTGQAYASVSSESWSQPNFWQKRRGFCWALWCFGWCRPRHHVKTMWKIAVTLWTLKVDSHFITRTKEQKSFQCCNYRIKTKLNWTKLWENWPFAHFEDTSILT